MKRVTFAVEYDLETAQPTHRRVMRTEGVSRAELLMWGPFGSETSLTWYDGDEAAVRKLLDGVDGIVDSLLVAGDEGTYAFVDRADFEFESRVLDLVAAATVAFLPPVVFEGDGTVAFDVVGSSTQLSSFHDGLTDLAVARVERVTEFRRLSTGTTMTDRQRTALQTAVALGYYDVPRTATVGDVASELDCARSTAGELLRKGEAAAIRALVRE
ncbi:helix-turn-helix domain-containing protein [Haloarculaceae archaeon H-GB2-1]|nr:helix-turn-helix domain-containing protein [Haloarculaceae archaeon H-GB1-1]MEA5408121.1 helix-turn-helix domain-containing protein [Haloarculaceae archaeon H-GB2-1]